MSENEGTHPVEAPTLASAHEALKRLYGPHSENLWRTLLLGAGLNGEETDAKSFGRLVVAMQSADPVTRLCARGLSLRMQAFMRLAPSRVVFEEMA